MRKKKLIKKLNLSDSDLESIKKSVADVESRTTGEIAVAVAAESASYSFWELLAADILAAIVLIGMLPFADKFTQIYQRIYWNNAPAWVIPAFFLIACFGVIIIGFYLANIPLIDRLVIPRAVKISSVNKRAMRCFLESGVYKTKEHSGILIFVSYMEHEVRILADSGISEKISQDLWDLISDELCENLKNGNVALAFTNAIEKCGALLAEQFPPHEENPNELSDGLIILEDEKW